MARIVDIDFGIDQFLKDAGKFEAKYEHAVRVTLNDVALLGSRYQHQELRKRFTLRNRFTEGSIFPKQRGQYGKVKTSASVFSMVSTTGTVQEYLEKQQEGFASKNPEVPTNKARVAASPKKIIAKKGKLKTLRSEKKMRPSAFKRQKKREDKIKAMLAMAKKIKFKGVIQIKKDGFLPAGFYRVVNRRKSLVMIRRSQKGVKFRKAEHWHEKAINRMNAQDLVAIFVRSTRQIGL